MKRETDLTRRILQSQNGRRIIDFVAPIYNDGEIALWLFESIGQILDDISENINSLRQQVTPKEATWTLPYWENEYNVIPESSWNEEDRRAAIIAKIKYVAPVNPEKLKDFSSAIMNVPCEIIENIGKNTFRILIHGWSNNFPRLKATINAAKPAHLIWNAIAEIPIIIIEERSGSIFEKDICFKIFVNYWDCYCFNGSRCFDGSIDFSFKRGGLNMIKTLIKARANAPYKLNPTTLQINCIQFPVKEKILLTINCGRTVFDNMGNFVRFNGDKKLDGSWLLRQCARRPIYKDFQAKTALKENKKLYAVATVVRAAQHTPIIFQQEKMKTGTLSFTPIKEIIFNKTVFLCNEKESISSIVQKIYFSVFSIQNKDCIFLTENYSDKFSEKKKILFREAFVSVSYSQSAGSGKAALSIGVFSITDISEKTCYNFYSYSAVHELSLNFSIAHINVFAKSLPLSFKKNAQKLCFEPYSFCNHNEMGDASLTIEGASSHDGLYRFDGTLHFDGKAIPRTEKI